MQKLLLCFALGGTVAVGGWVLAGRWGCSRVASWRGTGTQVACAVATAEDSKTGADSTAAAKTKEPDGCSFLGTTTPIIIRDEPAEDDATLRPMCAPGPQECPEPAGKVAAAEPSSACPMMMPYCIDEDDAADLPLEKPFKAAAVHGTKSGLPSCETSEFPWEEKVPDCKEDGHLHEQYSGIPFVGPRPVSPTPPLKGQTPGAVPGQENCKQPGDSGPKLHKSHYGSHLCPDCCPGHPNIDTMEYRKSDGGLNEYGPGGPM
jgi:hypothetical protein